jgi:hypothetical protein
MMFASLGCFFCGMAGFAASLLVVVNAVDETNPGYGKTGPLASNRLHHSRFETSMHGRGVLVHAMPSRAILQNDHASLPALLEAVSTI